MNVVAPPKARLLVEVVYDLVCPWCYLGVRRLFRTMRRRPDLLFELCWRPFLLNPDMPRSGMARSDYVIRKFGGEDRARRLYASITEIGAAEGVEFRFDRIRRTPSSVEAHPPGALGSAAGPQRRDGRSPVRRPLRRRAGHWRPPGAARHRRPCRGWTRSPRRHSCAATRTSIPSMPTTCGRTGWGSTVLPCFVVAGRHAIAGAQEPEVIERLLDVAAVDADDA